MSLQVSEGPPEVILLSDWVCPRGVTIEFITMLYEEIGRECLAPRLLTIIDMMLHGY